MTSLLRTHYVTVELSLCQCYVIITSLLRNHTWIPENEFFYVPIGSRFDFKVNFINILIFFLNVFDKCFPCHLTFYKMVTDIGDKDDSPVLFET